MSFHRGMGCIGADMLIIICTMYLCASTEVGVHRGWYISNLIFTIFPLILQGYGT